MEILIGLSIIALGSFGQSSSYVPINRIKNWNWENFWLVQGIFAWLIFPYLGAIAAVTTGGFFTNAVYCLWQNFKNGTFKEYIQPQLRVIVSNLEFSALAGLLWYSQFFGLEIGKSFLIESPTLLVFSWSILMSLNVIFSNVWGVVLHEWNGASKKSVAVLISGLLILILSIIFPSIF